MDASFRRLAAIASAAVMLAPVAVLRAQTAFVGGSLIDRTSRIPIQGARISILGTTLVTSTDSAGRFDVAGVPVGVRVMQIRAVGYAVGSWMMELTEGQSLRQEFELEGRTLTVDSLIVRAPDAGDDWRGEGGFERRRRGGHGFFITRTDIQQRRAETMADLLRVVPGLMTTCRNRNCQVLMNQGTRPCAPEYFLDGYPATFATGPSFPVQQIRGVEVYRSRFDVPAEFQRANLSCGVIAIWTIEPGRPLDSH